MWGSVLRLSARQQPHLLAPPPPGPGVCAVCLTPIPGGRLCHRCRAQPRAADSVLAISYSPHDGALHAMLRDYKATGRAARSLRVALSAVLWRFLDSHERCLAAAAAASRRGAAPAFDTVCIVPSTRRQPAVAHPLVSVLAAVEPVAPRLQAGLLEPSITGAERAFDPRRFRCARPLEHRSVLLVDDTWTTGASAQSAAAALKRAGAGVVGVLVIGRHVHADYGSNRAWLSGLEHRFEWDRCARCEQAVRCRGASPRALAVGERDGSGDASGSRVRLEDRGA